MCVYFFALKVLVWKELNYGSMTECEKQLLVSEVNLLRELKHPNIVQYYDRIIDRSVTTIYLVMEYCEGGDLSQLIARCKKERLAPNIHLCHYYFHCQNLHKMFPFKKISRKCIYMETSLTTCLCIT